jgi:predicted DNA-binding transcriptional regulator YafY
MADTALLAPADHSAAPIAVDASELRGALRRRLKVHFCYRDGEERQSARTVRPLALSFYGPVWLLAAWCELRQDFRSFRLDRMTRIGITDTRFKPERGKTLPDYVRRADNPHRLQGWAP